jgi:hypothetical protein
MIAVAMINSEQPGQRGLQECWDSAQRSLTSISATMGSAQAGQRGLQECCRSAQRWLTSISVAMYGTSGNYQLHYIHPKMFVVD